MLIVLLLWQQVLISQNADFKISKDIFSKKQDVSNQKETSKNSVNFYQKLEDRNLI